MIFNFFAHIFGKSTGIITTTIVENEQYIDVDDDDADGNDITISSNNCYLMAAPATGSAMPCQGKLLPNTAGTSNTKSTASIECKRFSQQINSSGGREFQQQTNHKTNKNNHSRNDSNQLNKCIAIFLPCLYCILTSALLFVIYMIHARDLATLRSDLNGRFVGRDDIGVIVRNILHDKFVHERTQTLKRR